MGEFVEQSLESLLPTFEQLSFVQLFTENEVAAFIKRCRQFEYRLNKHEKTPRDFDLYADYLCDFLTLLKARRTRMQYWQKLKVIDRPLLKKVASIYRRAADRFQGDFHRWEKLINFLTEHTMRRELAAAYTRALQIHGQNENLRRDFALWQFFSAASPQNARTQILASLRLFPHSSILYTAFFTIELHFVEKVLKRRKFITEERGKRKKDEDESDTERVYDEEVSDSIMNLDVVRTVIEQALSAIPPAQASGMLVEMWKECSKVSLIPNIEKIKNFLMDKLKEFDNEDTRLFEIEEACISGCSKFDAFESAIAKTPTEKMYRFYLEWLLELSTKDAFSEMKTRSLLRKICEGGWMTNKEWVELEKSMAEAEDEFDDQFLEKCLQVLKHLQQRSGSARLWQIYLERRLEGSSDPSQFRELCNRALEKVDPEESFPIWELAIDHTIINTPNEVEQVFQDAIKHSLTSVSSRIKILFVDYLKQLLDDKVITLKQYKDRIAKLVSSKPNSSDFYCHVHRIELDRADPDVKFAGSLLNAAVIEEVATVEAVILYAKWALKYDISKFHVVHQTGVKLFKGDELNHFLVEWTKLVQNLASDAVKDDQDKVVKEGKANSPKPNVAKAKEEQCITTVEVEVEEKVPKKPVKRKNMLRKGSPQKLSKLR